MSFDIITIGSATVDHFADIDSELIRIDTPTQHEELIAYPLGSKLLINELITTIGGGGTNTAVALSRLGLNTGYLGKIGSDFAGDFVVDTLHQLGVNFLGGRGGQTGFSVILNSMQDDRTILVFRGSNDQLEYTDVSHLDAPWIFLSSMLDTSWDTVVHLITNGQFKVAFNPSNYQAELGYKKLYKLIDKVSILIMNREEACKFLGKDHLANHNILDLLSSLYALPPKIVVITGGAVGAYVYDGEMPLYGKPNPNINILETTGAGDAFSSTFTASIIKGKNIKAALHYAMTNAESVIQHKGAKEKLLCWDELVLLSEKYERHIELLS